MKMKILLFLMMMVTPVSLSVTVMEGGSPPLPSVRPSVRPCIDQKRPRSPGETDRPKSTKNDQKRPRNDQKRPRSPARESSREELVLFFLQKKKKRTRTQLQRDHFARVRSKKTQNKLLAITWCISSFLMR